jgi:hypothetical protein
VKRPLSKQKQENGMMSNWYRRLPQVFRFTGRGLAASIVLTATIAGSAAADTPIDSAALLKGFVHQPVDFAPGERFNAEARKFQGIPTIERAPGGRLWAVWYAGPNGEDRYNYLVAATSADHGKTWSDIKFAVDPDGDGPKRVADPCLWLDPQGKLWLFWWLQDRGDGVTATMAMTTENPDDENPVWTEPRSLFPGVMMNKPIVTAAGEWLMPSAIWKQDGSSMVIVSKDQGRNWALRGKADVPAERRNCDEHMIVEKKDGSLWMLVRTTGYGIGESVSTDQGRTWTGVRDYSLHASSRFFIRRLRSGNLLLIRHGKLDERGSRTDLTAYLSDDDGATWKGGLLLDDRPSVSYPDATQAPDGTIYAIHDWARYDDKEITFTAFTEADILAGAYVSPAARPKTVINKSTGVNAKPRLKKPAAAAATATAAVAVAVALRADAAAVPLVAGPAAKMEAPAGAAQAFKGGAKLFSDRAHQLADPPEAFKDKTFLVSSIEAVSAVCAEPGMVYVFTPAKDRNRDSVEDALLAQGFVKTSEPEFILFKRDQPNVKEACTIYQKKVEKGETVRFGKWGVLVY